MAFLKVYVLEYKALSLSRKIFESANASLIQRSGNSRRNRYVSLLSISIIHFITRINEDSDGISFAHESSSSV